MRSSSKFTLFLKQGSGAFYGTVARAISTTEPLNSLDPETHGPRSQVHFSFEVVRTVGRWYRLLAADVI